MSQCDSRRPLRNSTTASRVFSGEAVVISPGRNAVCMFNEVGSRIWELSDGQRTSDEIAAALVEEYAVTVDEARASVKQFVDELLERELLQLVEQ